MYDQDAAGTAEIGDLIVDVLLGCETVDKVADTLNLPKGQVFGWCDRVRESLGQFDRGTANLVKWPYVISLRGMGD